MTGSPNGSFGGFGKADPAQTLGVGDGPVLRTFRDYMLILRERLWYVVVVFLIVLLSSVAYTLRSTKLYTAISSIEILPRDAVVMKVQEVRDGDLRGPEDLNTQVKILESAAIVQKVGARLSADEAKALLAPYEKGGGTDPIVPEEVLVRNRRVLPVRQTRVLQICYTHPDPDTAARIANLFVEEYMNYNVRWRVDESMRAVEDLKVRAEEQSKKVQELGNALQEYREKHNMVSLDQRKDIVTEKLKALNAFLTGANSRVTEAGVQWNQVVECRKNGGNLAELAFIAALPQVGQLQHQIDSQKVDIADLRQRYRSEHPKMLAANQALSQAQTELRQALDHAAETVHNAYETAQRDAAQAKADLAAQETEALKLDRLAVDYGTQQNELNVNQELLANIVTRMRETSMNATIEEHNARIVDPAVRPRKYSSPNVPLDLAAGIFLGLGLGLSLAFCVAFIDDRVKTAYQIESLIGLPLIGIVPQTRKMGNPERAQLVRSHSDPLAAEAFLTIHSNLRLKPEAKNAKVIMVTSTRPGEGKSFVTSNLALAFAEHGERTILVDCDLRKPSVNKLFGLANAKGVIDYCTAGASLDALVIRNHLPNFDLLLAGGRAVNPTHILNHEAFPRLIAELRKRYDRVFIDTPPLAPVSDAMIVLPHVDGALFTIRFNHVRTRGAKFCARRILETKVPCFGAVLNGLHLALSEYYYAEYYDKSYSSYIREASTATGNKPANVSSSRILLTKILGPWAGLIQGDTLTWDRWRWLRPRLPETRNQEQLIDVGCGTGAFTICAAMSGYGALGLTWDITDSTVAATRAKIVGAEKASFKICDVRTMDEHPELQNRFDVAICCENMEHILDDFRLARSLFGCLRPGGRLLLTTPNFLNHPISSYDLGPFKKIEDGWHVRRGYTPSSLSEVITKAGFVIEEISYCSGFFSQKVTGFLRRFGGKKYGLGWALTIWLRPFIPVADMVFHACFRYPKYSIGIVAYKNREP